MKLRRSSTYSRAERGTDFILANWSLSLNDHGGILSDDKTKLAESSGNKFMKDPRVETGEAAGQGGYSCIPRAACDRHAELSLSLATRPGFLSPLYRLLFFPSPFVPSALFRPAVSPLFPLFSLLHRWYSFLPSLSGSILLVLFRLDRLICVAQPSESISRTALISAALMNFNRERARHPVKRSSVRPRRTITIRARKESRCVNWDLSLYLFLFWHRGVYYVGVYAMSVRETS